MFILAFQENFTRTVIERETGTNIGISVKDHEDWIYSVSGVQFASVGITPASGCSEQHLNHLGNVEKCFCSAFSIFVIKHCIMKLIS